MTMGVIRKYYDFPIEHIFEALSALEQTDELDSIIDQLTDKMVTYFESIDEVDGIKLYGSIKYYPNGCCEWGNRMIILPPWEINPTPNIINRKTNNKTPRRSTQEKILENFGTSFEQYQIKEYLGKDYSADITPWSQTLSEKIETLKSIDAASEEIRNISESAIKVLFTEVHRFHERYYTDELCVATCQLLTEFKTRKRNIYHIQNEFAELWDEQVKNMDNPIHVIRPSSHHSYKIDALAKEIEKLENLLEQIQNIKEKTAVAVLKKLNII